MRSPSAFILWSALCCTTLVPGARGDDQPFERPPISYSSAKPRDAIAALQARLDAGQLRFAGDDKTVLRALLAALDIPEESQMLVFSKTSFQRDKIDPGHPRALYFNDSVYVGWSPGGLAEVAAIDPVLGPVFYKFDPRSSSGENRFVRDADCLRCHGGNFIRDIPGLLSRSVYPDLTGEPLHALGSELVDSATPFHKRYGGWYVTGFHGRERHRGNLVLSANREPTPEELNRTANLKALEAMCDLRPYLVRSSDLVAILVFEHQITVQNVLTKANQHCLAMLAYQQGVQRDLKELVTTEPTFESVNNAFTEAVQEILDALLCKNEAPLPEGGVVGVGGFAQAFDASTDTPDAQPSLKQLEMKRRLLKYRCSYLILSESFHRLQPALRARVLRRLWRILSEPEMDSRYAYLETEERKVIRTILTQSLPSLPAVWKR